MRHFFATLATLAATLLGVAAAHDFYIALDDWRVANGGLATAEFRAGHPRGSAPWTLLDGRAVRLETFGPMGRLDQNDALIFPTAGGKSGAAVRLEGAGIHVVAFETDEALQVLDAEKFNAYLAEEGLFTADDWRRRNDRTNAPGRELYSRRAKALVRVGDTEDGPPAPIGQDLEIVPLSDPFDRNEEAPLSLRVDFRGAPLAGATLTLESLSVGLFPEIHRLTDTNGVATFVMPKRGAWMMSVVWTEPITDERADFRTIFSSLTFAYDADLP